MEKCTVTDEPKKSRPKGRDFFNVHCVLRTAYFLDFKEHFQIVAG